MSLEKLKKAIDQHKYISFDLFDTLIFRTVSKPEKIYDLVQLEFNNGHSNRIDDFAKKRIKAELAARKKAKGNEINIDEIYDEIEYEKNLKNELENLEKMIEIKNCVSNLPMIEIVKYAKEQGKIILITTDMYLDRNTIKSILDKINVEYDKLYISGELRATKDNKELFKLIQKELNFNSKEVLHIGDNFQKDIKNANACGWDAEVTLDVRKKKTIAAKSIESNQLEQFLVNKSICYDNNSLYHIGYELLGPFLWSYINWIKKTSDDNDVGKLIFISREGYLLKRAYETLYTDSINTNKYISLNKNVLRFPALAIDSSIECLVKTIASKNKITVVELFNYFRIYNTEKRDELCKKYSLSLMQTITKNHLFTEKIQAFIDDIISLNDKVIKEQLDLFVEYCKANGIVTGKVAFINNSINGNAQILVSDILNKLGYKCNILGLQFVNSQSCKQHLGERVYSFFDRKGIVQKIRARHFASNCLIFEHLCFEPVGSSVCLKKQNDKIVVLSEELINEQKNFDIVSKIQEYALQFIKDFKDIATIGDYKAYEYKIDELFDWPLMEDARIIANLYDDDVDGSKMLIDLSDSNIRYSLLKLLKRVKKEKWRSGYIAASNYPKSYLTLMNILQIILDFKNRFSI